jgi:hypothetical protein
MLGSVGLLAFGFVIWRLIQVSPTLALGLASFLWISVAVLAWMVRRRLRLGRIGDG